MVAGLATCPHTGSPDGFDAVLAARVSDPLAGSKSTLGTSDCQGVLSALVANSKKFGAFATHVGDPPKVIERILHRSGRTRSSSQFRGPKSLFRLLSHRRRGLLAESRDVYPLNTINADRRLQQRMTTATPNNRGATRNVSTAT